MHLAHIATMTAFLASTSLARLNYGKAYYDSGKADNAIWISGENACQYTYLGADGTNPCSYNGGRFTASNGYSYQLKNCGGSNFELLNSDGSLNAVATTDGHSNDGSGCNNQYGAYHVSRQFHFG